MEYRKEKEIKYTDFDGIPQIYKLDESETIIQYNCPLDGTPLLETIPNCGFDRSPDYLCINCGNQYLWRTDAHGVMSKKSLEGQLEDYVKNWKKELTDLNKKEARIKKLLELNDLRKKKEK